LKYAIDSKHLAALPEMEAEMMIRKRGGKSSRKRDVRR
jgi:hypothetical protein